MAQYINIDTEDTLDQVVSVTLESNLYIFRLRYNNRSGWQMGIYDADLYSFDVTDNSGAKLYGERKLMPFQNFLKYTHDVENLPTGYLFLYDSEYVDKEDYELPSRYNLGQGNRFVLVYFTASEYEEYLAEVS